MEESQKRAANSPEMTVWAMNGKDKVGLFFILNSALTKSLSFVSILVNKISTVM